MALTNYTESQVLNHMLGKSSWSMPSTVYVALFTSATDDSGGGTEVSDSGYSRQSITSTMSSSSSGSDSSNGDIVRFGPAGDSGGFGTVTHAAIYDASSGGNMLAHGSLDSSVTIDQGDAFEFGTGDLVASME